MLAHEPDGKTKAEEADQQEVKVEKVLTCTQTIPPRLGTIPNQWEFP